MNVGGDKIASHRVTLLSPATFMSEIELSPKRVTEMICDKQIFRHKWEKNSNDKCVPRHKMHDKCVLRHKMRGTVESKCG